MLICKCPSLPLLALSLFAVLPAPSWSQGGTPFPAPRALGDTDKLGRNVQRTMRLLATSTRAAEYGPRVLYGQSITGRRVEGGRG